jgi:hypothetical protein
MLGFVVPKGKMDAEATRDSSSLPSKSPTAQGDWGSQTRPKGKGPFDASFFLLLGSFSPPPILHPGKSSTDFKIEEKQGSVYCPTRVSRFCRGLALPCLGVGWMTLQVVQS